MNFSGFNYTDLKEVSKFQTFEQLVRYQVNFYSKISGVIVQSQDIDFSRIPTDLKFIATIEANWNVYLTRRDQIMTKI